MLFKEITCIGDLYPHMADLPEVVQLVKHSHEASLRNAVGPWSVELKEDGNYCFMLVASGAAYAFGRSGLRFTNVGFIEEQFITYTPGVYLGEIVNDGWELETLSGVISPARVNPLDTSVVVEHMKATEIRLFDFIPLECFVVGLCSDPYKFRRALLDNYAPLHHKIRVFEYSSLVEAEAACQELIKQGHEGGCIKALNADWKRGRRDWRSMKVVKETSFDLECVSVEEGKGKRKGVAANFFFRWKGDKVLKADLGKGWTDEKRLEAWLNPPIGCVFRVTAMQDSSKGGLLRKAKVQEQRFDKKADY